MSKSNFFVKYLKNINYFINSLLEKNLNKLNFENLSYLLKNNKLILTFVAVFVVFISYLLLPTFYKQSDIEKWLKAELQSKLDINFKFSQDLEYNFFPRPHFKTKETTIFYDENVISKINKVKIFISFDNFFSLKNIEIKDLIFENANFNLNKNNYNFFLQLLNKKFEEGNLKIKDSNVFFRNSMDEVLFINKILNMKYYYEKKELKNIFYSENEIFNVPFSIETFLNKEKNKIFSEINLDLLKLKIKNDLSFLKEKIIGKSDLLFNKQKIITEYEIEKNFFKFNIFDKIDQPSLTYKGIFNLKPFFANLDGNLKELNLNFLLGTDSILVQLLKTEILNNKNIDFKTNIKADNVNNNLNFKNFNLRSKIQEGLIDFDNTKFEWRDFADFEILESLIFLKNGELVLDGKLKIKINDYNKIYKFLLTPKKYRKKIKLVDLNFTYNFDQKIAEIKDFKVDSKINQNVNRILDNNLLEKKNLKNKIFLKRFLNKVIKGYSG